MIETKRYLKDSDYKRAILPSHLAQLIQDDQETLLDAEIDAKSTVISMLTDEYTIEDEYALGESINRFGYEREFIKGSYAIIDDRTAQSNAYVSPSRPPLVQDYWRQLDESEVDEDETYEEYSQNLGYYVGTVVSYNGQYFQCMISNGVDIQYGTENIIQPIINHWSVTADGTGAVPFSITETYLAGDVVSYDGLFYECTIDVTDSTLRLYPDSTLWTETEYVAWSAAEDYSLYDANLLVVNENELDYALIDPNNAIIGKTPVDSINDGDGAWKEITFQAYDRSERYERPSGFDGYVSYENEFFFVSEKDEPFVNAYTDDDDFVFTPVKDPRNRNIIICMIHIVLYQLHSVVVPDNIPTMRIDMYNNSIAKLDAFSTMKKNPNLPRKEFTYTVVNPMNGIEVDVTRSSSRWAVNDSEVTRDSWNY